MRRHTGRLGYLVKFICVNREVFLDRYVTHIRGHLCEPCRLLRRVERDFEADEDQEEDDDDEPAAEGSDEKGKGKEKPREKTPESTAPEEVQVRCS